MKHYVFLLKMSKNCENSENTHDEINKKIENHIFNFKEKTSYNFMYFCKVFKDYNNYNNYVENFYSKYTIDLLKKCKYFYSDFYIDKNELFESLKNNYSFSEVKNILKNIPGNYVAYRNFDKPFNQNESTYVIKKYNINDILNFRQATLEHIVEFNSYNFVNNELELRHIMTKENEKKLSILISDFDKYKTMISYLSKNGFVNKTIVYDCEDLKYFVECFNEKHFDKKLLYIEREITNIKELNGTNNKLCSTFMSKFIV